MKKIITLTALAVLITASARAQQRSQAVPVTGLTTTVLAATSSNLSSVIVCSGQSHVGIIWSGAGSGASTSNMVMTISKSLDNTLYDGGSVLLTNVMNGTTPVTTFYNVDTGGALYLKMAITNTHASVNWVSNVVQYGVKTGAP